MLALKTTWSFELYLFFPETLDHFMLKALLFEIGWKKNIQYKLQINNRKDKVNMI